MPTSRPPDWLAVPAAAAAGGAVAFAVLATLNAGGYRYGASDQAFYIPAILHQLDPALYPRDWAMLGAQGRFFFVDEIFGALVRSTGIGLPAWFVVAQLATLGALYWGALSLGRTFLASPWAVTAWLAALTLRHRIAKTGANTLEGYFHPRMLVFGLGLTSLALYMRGRPWWALGLALASGLLHPTTAALFVALLLVATAVSEPGARAPIALAALGAAVTAAGAVALGLFDVSTMDAGWMELVGMKDYVFPTRWSGGTWAINLLGPAVIVGVLARRLAAGSARPREIGLATGALALVAGFLATLPAIASGVALAVQLQTSRVFWPVEIVATLFLVRGLADRWGARPPLQWTALALLALSLARGVYVTGVEHSAREAVALTLPANDWTRALEWIRTHTPRDAFVLADPGHAWKPGMGTAVRIGAERDVFLEDTKDVAMAMYSRDIAHEVARRIGLAGTAVGGDAAAVIALARQAGLTVLATDRMLDLPERFRSGRIRVYALAP
ncbi:MAG: hypothetical protein R2745_15855 [Vicinamibacterales bacterium]